MLEKLLKNQIAEIYFKSMKKMFADILCEWAPSCSGKEAQLYNKK